MTSTQAGTETIADERADILDTLGKARHFLRHTVQSLTDGQARERSTVSELTLGGLVKHVADVEEDWARFARTGEMAGGEGFEGEPTPEMIAMWAERFAIPEGKTLADMLDHYDDVARRTDELVRTLPDLGVSHPLPSAPWFEPGARWSARRTFLHIVAETAQHSGHADIIREAIDGQKSMG